MNAPVPDLVPRPTSVETRAGHFVLDADTVIMCDPGAEDCAALLQDYLAVTGFALPLSAARQTNVIALQLTTSGDDESYRLEVDTDGARVVAATTAGLRHGIQTLRQLLPCEVYSRGSAPDVTWRVPCVEISDSPRMPWRGSLLDVARWYLPLDYLYRYVEVLAMHKLNRLHLHLTDDQGWRFEVLRHPELTRVGAWRAESPLGHARDGRYDGTPHGGFYTQHELRALVDFAARRGVVVVPEIDLPGHTTAAIAAYPELGNGVAAPAVSTSWTIHTSVLNLEDATIRFFQDVLAEAMDVFPSPWVHLGGDECPTDEWISSPAARQRIAKLGISDADHAQDWLTGVMCAFVRANGRTPIVWDEAATETLDTEAVVMSWRNEQVGIEAARRGHQVIMTPRQSTYFDAYQSERPGEPVAHGGLTTLRDVYAFDPIPSALTGEARSRILGTQGMLWGEYLPTPDRVDDMAYPRMCALAERSWSPTPDDYGSFEHRMGTHYARLLAAGVRPRLPADPYRSVR